MKIKEEFPGIKENVFLAPYTTFKIGGRARYFFIVKEKKDLIEALQIVKQLKLPFFILGRGSNILVSDEGYRGLVIKCQMSNVKFQKNKIYSEAGTELKNLVRLSLEKSLAGLEWAAGIPGTIGGAIYGDTAAFGFSIADAIKSVEILDSKTLKIKNLSLKDCNFFNKESIFKNNKNLTILSVVLKLKKGNKKEIQKKIKEYLNHRKKTQPLNFSSAGCIFKNIELADLPEYKKCHYKYSDNKSLIIQGEFVPVSAGKIPAGYLIEKCGLKGKKIGGAQISEKHANFIVNLKEARAKDILKLINLIKQKVKRKFGIILKEEIQIIQ